MLHQRLLRIILAIWIPFASVAYAAENVSRQTLDNGLRVVVVQSPLAPVVSTVMNYRVGSNEAPPGFPGSAHALEHMMFRGSPGLPADQLANIAAAMGGDFNADTQQTVTQYFFTVPAQDLDIALRIEATRMRSILCTDALWEHERGAIEQEVAGDLSNPQYVFYTQLLSAMFQGTPYEHDALGTRPSFDKTTAGALRQFHDAWYAPNNAVLVIVGDVDPARAFASVRSLFGSIPSKPLAPRPEIKLARVKTATLRVTTDSPYGLAVASFRLPGSSSADFAAAKVLADVLDSQRGSLYALVPQGKALYAGFDFRSLPDASLGYAAAAFPSDGDGAALLSQVRKIVQEDVAHGFPQELVDAAKHHEIADAEFSKNSISGLAMDWSQAVAVDGRQSPNDEIADIRKVTVEDVDRVARQYLTPEEAIPAILTPQSSGQPVSTASFGGAESFAPKTSSAAALPTWARAAANRLTIPPSGARPVVTILPNGLKLLVQPESISDSVTVEGHIRNNPDLEAPPKKDGVDEVLDQLLSYGTESLDRLKFQKALDDIGAVESAGADFSLEVLSSEFERGVELLAANEIHPALPAADFPVVRQEAASAAAGELGSPAFLTQRAIDSALLPKDDPDLRYATPATISSLTLADVRDYHRQTFRPDLTTIVVIGRVSPELARTVMERYFGGWKADGKKPQTVLPPIPPNKPSTAVVPNASRVQDEVTLAETVALNRSSHDYYALKLGNSVLSGAFYASRLSTDLRENSGLVYTVSATLEAGRTRAFFSVVYGCDPPNVSKARAIVERDLRDMRDHSATAAVLRRAKVLLIQQIPLSEASTQNIASNLLNLISEELPLDEPALAARRYAALTPDQVREAFARWIRPDALVQITQGPDPK